MKHDAALVSAYHDGMLPPSKRRQVESHIRVCAECHTLLQDYRATRTGIQALPWRQAPATMLDQVRAQVAVERRRERQQSRFRPLAGLAASLATAAAAFFAGTVLPVSLPTTMAEQRPVASVSVPSNDMNTVARDSVIELQFASPVDRGNVEQSLQLTPPLAAHLEWQDDRLRIVPKDQLEADATYTIAVAPDGSEADAAAYTTQVTTSIVGGGGKPTAPASLPAGPANLPLVQAITAPSPTATPISPQPTPTPTWAVAALSAGVATPPVKNCTAERSSALWRLASERPDLVARLGCAAATDVRVLLAEQPFEVGVLVWRADLRWTYALQSQPRRWSSYSDTASVTSPGDTLGPMRSGADFGPVGPTPGAGRSVFLTATATATPVSFRELPTEPSPTFLRLWRAQPDIRNLIGGPVRGERQGTGIVQDFQHGLAVVTEFGAVYTLFGDRTWVYLAESADSRQRATVVP